MTFKQGPRATNRSRGFNLVEAAIVLGVVGLVIGGIWVAAASVQENLRISRAQQQTIAFFSNARSLFQNVRLAPGATLYDMTDTPQLTSSLFPADAMSNGVAKTPWDLPFFGHISMAGGGAVASLQIGVSSVAACSKLANSLYAAYKDEQDAYLDVGSDGFYANVMSDPTEAIEGCRDAYNARTDELYLYVRLSLPL